MAKRKKQKVTVLNIDGSNATEELDKMKAVQNESQAIGAFIEWLGTKDYVIGRHLSMEEMDEMGLDPDETNIVPVYTSIEKMLAEYFEIDLNKVEKEKMKILDNLRETNERKNNGNNQ